MRKRRLHAAVPRRKPRKLRSLITAGEAQHEPLVTSLNILAMSPCNWIIFNPDILWKLLERNKLMYFIILNIHHKKRTSCFVVCFLIFNTGMGPFLLELTHFMDNNKYLSHLNILYVVRNIFKYQSMLYISIIFSN